MLRLHTLSPALLQNTSLIERRDNRVRLSAQETADLIAEYERNLVVPRLGGASALLAEYAGLFKLREEDEVSRADDAGDAEDGGPKADTPRGRRSETDDDSLPANGALGSSTRYPSLATGPASSGASPAGLRGRKPQPDTSKSILATYVALKAAARTPSMSVSRSRGGSHGSKDPPAPPPARSRRSSAHSAGASAEAFRGRRAHLDQVEEEEEVDNDLVEQLVRENLMLKNELNFELYLKSQHLQQMGTLHKEHVRESGLEAEVQNLVRRLSLWLRVAPDVSA